MPDSVVEERPDSTTGVEAMRSAAARLMASTVGGSQDNNSSTNLLLHRVLRNDFLIEKSTLHQ